MGENKKVLILSHASQQPPYNTMLRFHNWGKQLLKLGYDVTIIAASTVHNTNIDVIDELGKSSSICDGIKYVYIRTPKYEGNGIQRIKNMYTYCLKLNRVVKGLKKPNYIISTGAYKYPFVRKIFPELPVIVDIVDLWPLSIIEYANISKKNPFIQYLYWLERKAYINADALIFSMEGGSEYIKEQPYAGRVNMDKVFHINMGCDYEEKEKQRTEIISNLPWDNNGKTNVVYCGSIRKANDIRVICDAAKEIQNRNIQNVEFQIYGNGDQLEDLKEYCTENDIHNIHFYGRIEKEKIAYILSKSDINVITYKQVGLMRYGGSQSKLFDYLASGRPILCNAHFGYNLITRYNCGLVTKDQSAAAFADTVEKYISLEDSEKKKMGDNAKNVAKMYDQPQLVQQLLSVFEYVQHNPSEGKKNSSRN